MSNEGSIYLCELTKREDSFLIIVLENREILAIGETIEECLSDIREQILLWNGDGEAVLELLPPTETENTSCLASMFATSYNDSVSAIKNLQLYTKGSCPKCSFGQGKRNNTPLVITSKPKGNVVGVWGAFPELKIYSEEFISCLSEKELGILSLLPVYFENEKTGYFEIISKSVINCCGLKSAEYPSAFHQNWKCDTCGRIAITALSKKHKEGTIFINRDSIPHHFTGPLVINEGMSFTLAFGVKRWQELLKKCKGLVSNEVVVLPKEMCEMPDLESPEKFDWF